MLPNCTIVIPTRNRADDLAETARNLRERGLASTPCIVVDDASDDPDATRRALEPLAGADVIRLPQRCGTATARNHGLRHAETDYCFFLEDDTDLEDASPLRSFLDSLRRDDIAVWRFEMIRASDGDRAGIPADLPGTDMHTFLGSGVLMDRKRMLEVGGYRDIFMYRQEEDDLAVRTFRAGYRMRYEPGIRIIHRHTGAARCSAEYAFLSARNVLLLYGLNWPQPGGLFLGFAKSVSVIVKGRDHPLARVRGCAAGLVAVLRNWSSRTPLTREQAAQYRRLRQSSTYP
jgi:GT2 family glycosyltransferase